MVGSVLLYQDDAAIRGFVADVLRDEGHQVQICTSLQAVRDAATTNPTALALVDTWEPDSYSLDAPQRDAIRAFAAQVPTVMLTAQAWATATPPSELGLLALLPMPIDLDLLVDTVGQQVARLVELSQAAREQSRQLKRCLGQARDRLQRAQNRLQDLQP
jgi:DNA-binding NtrC family response regulator